MNREIKFRAWDKSKKEMIYSGLEYQLRALQLPEVKNPQESFIGFTDWEKEHFNLMQYTGLKDKNGVEIYDCDVIKTPLGIICKVFFGQRTYLISDDYIEVNGWLVENIINGAIEVLDKSVCAGEIIGNIYEPPELLNK